MPDNWHVVDQIQRTDVTPDGRVIDVMRVHFITATGVQGYFDVPLSVYSTEAVTAIGDQRIAAIDAVAQL